ncbi:MAG TPA: hypothetical protein VFQ38_07145 [Longimicrobiales bacterium]|nr:hypothetical protein [Longimicrobiales bacterium]
MGATGRHAAARGAAQPHRAGPARPRTIRAALRALRLLLALLALATTARAQEAPRLGPGTRLRVTVVRPSAQVYTGTFGTRTDTTLVLSGGASSRSIPLSSIGRLEWSAGRKPGILGGVLGLVVGVAAGGAAGCAANRDSYGVFCGGQDDTKVVVGAALGGLAGATAGALLLRRERWRPVELGRLQPGGR